MWNVVIKKEIPHVKRVKNFITYLIVKKVKVKLLFHSSIHAHQNKVSYSIKTFSLFLKNSLN
jgi:hypothetical protein